tara:strand:+ start:2275 stop:3153 length:879 start_codon:yes stop_codon:yes gene_type:complete
MKIGIYVCSNGYGHFHRMLQVCAHLPFHEIDIHCEKYQYNRFKPTQDNINFIFYDESNIRWDRKRVGTIEVGDIDKYDKVITDNLVDVLKYRPDALLSGSFLWSDIWREKYGNNDFSDEQDKIFHDVKPQVVCNGDVVFGQLKKYQNKVDIGWGCKDNSTEDFNLSRIVCITPSLNYTEKYTEKFLEIRSEFQNDVDFSFNINHTDNSMFVIRPGLGMITTCVSHRIPIVALWDEDDSIEIQHLAHKVEELGIGISLNVHDDFILPPDVIKYRESFKKLNLNGYLKFAGLLT